MTPTHTASMSTVQDFHSFAELLFALETRPQHLTEHEQVTSAFRGAEGHWALQDAGGGRREENLPSGMLPTRSWLGWVQQTLQLGMGADTIQEIECFEPQREGHLSDLLAPKSFPALRQTVKLIN